MNKNEHDEYNEHELNEIRRSVVCSDLKSCFEEQSGEFLQIPLPRCFLIFLFPGQQVDTGPRCAHHFGQQLGVELAVQQVATCQL